MNKYTLLYLYIGVLFGIILTACENHAVYFHYEHIPDNGWEKSDTVDFYIPGQSLEGKYEEEVGIRIDNSFPYQSISLTIEQTVFPSMEISRDTISCELVDEKGNALGPGINQYQYLFHLNTIRLRQGDSLHIAIHHNMKREILPGITDLGIRLKRR